MKGKNNLQRKLDRHISFYYFLLGDISYLVLGKVFSRLICSYFREHFYSLTPLQRWELPFRKWKSEPIFVFEKRPNQGKSILCAVTSFCSNLNSKAEKNCYPKNTSKNKHGKVLTTIYTLLC